MTARIPLNHPCIYKHHLEKNTGNHHKKDSNFHAIVWRPIGGVTDEQVQVLYNQFSKDLLGKGQPRIAHRGTFSIEGEGRERHVHIALILIGRAETWVTSKRYKALLGDQTLLDGCCIDGVKIPKKVALLCCQPACNKMQNYKQTTWLAYPVKEAAKNPDFMPTDYDNGTTRRMGYVFDGLDGVELRDAKTRFETALRTFWKSKCVSTKIIYFNKSMDKLANEFYPIHCPDLPWCPENRAEVLARMYLHQGRFLKYEFASNFFKEKYIIERFTLHQDDEDYHAIVVGAIQDTFDIVENGGRKKSQSRKRQLSNDELKAQEIQFIDRRIAYHEAERQRFWIARCQDEKNYRPRVKSKSEPWRKCGHPLLKDDEKTAIMNHHKDMIELSKKFKEGCLALDNKKVIENVYDPDIKKWSDKLMKNEDEYTKEHHTYLVERKKKRMMELSDVVLEPALKRRRM
jgi:hypothetical protein